MVKIERKCDVCITLLLGTLGYEDIIFEFADTAPLAFQKDLEECVNAGYMKTDALFKSYKNSKLWFECNRSYPSFEVSETLAKVLEKDYDLNVERQYGDNLLNYYPTDTFNQESMNDIYKIREQKLKEYKPLSFDPLLFLYFT